MDERQTELGAVLAETRRRWIRRVRQRAWTVGAVAATLVLGVGALTVWLIASEGLALPFVAFLVLGVVFATLACAAWPVAAPSNLQLARYIEERLGGLDDVVVTAVQHGDTGTPVARALAVSAARAVEADGVDRVIAPDVLRSGMRAAVAATLLLVVAATAFAPTVGRGAAVLAAYVLPSRLVIEVTPGNARIRQGEPVDIVVRLRGLDEGLVPELHLGVDDEPAVFRMMARPDGSYVVSVDRVTTSFAYAVQAGPARSERYAIEAIRPARVTRIDLRYRYPEGMGLPPRVQEDGGDIYGPQGTTVDLTITTDKDVTSGELALGDGKRIDLAGGAQALRAELPISSDGSYRIALTDVDGLENAGDTEYFIRVLNDRPPDVRIVRPGGDKQVTPLEEVIIEASADDDFGLASLDIVFQAPGRKDTVLPIETGRGVTASGRHLVQLESLGVAPGDFVTYYARARDIGQGRRAAESRSDIFFLEVKPFEETFVAAQSQAMGMEGGSPDVQELAEAQKQIIAATWKLDARAQRAGNARPDADIRAIAQAQNELRTRAAQVAGDVAVALADPRRRRPRPGQTAAPGASDPMARAVEAMGRATGELEALKTAEALPHEMEALEQLLKANADVQQRQIARQQGGGGGSSRQAPDLSALFDQQLRQQQQTNYETPDSTETRRESTPEDDALAKLRELARRQEALRREQQELAQNRARMTEDERKRRLERLTREQQQLTEQAGDLSRQLQQPQGMQAGTSRDNEQNASGQRSGTESSQGQSSSSSSGRRLREIAEQMRGAAGELQREDPEQASASAGRALEGLRELTRQMERARPDERRRAMGDLQFEARQLAEAERRLANEAERMAAGQAGEQARRRVAAEQERLADRTDRLRDAARELSQPSADGAGDAQAAQARQAARQAATDIEREELANRMRASAEAMRRDGAAGRQGAASRERARTLDRIAGQLSEAAGTADAETERLSDQLARASELRDRLNQLQEAIDTLQQAERGGAEGNDGAQPQAGSSQAPETSGEQPGGATGTDGGTPRDGQAQAREGSGAGGAGGQRGALQREAEERMREAQQLAGELRGQHPELRSGMGGTPESWYPSLSAPGTESFKQDYGRWESLRDNLLLALERTETRLSSQLREREARERLNAGGHQGAPDGYRSMVDRYYQSLAAPRRAPR